VTQLYIGREAGYISPDSAKEWVAEAKELAKMLGALIRHWKQEATKKS
jgi:four helix bundle protein